MSLLQTSVGKLMINEALPEDMRNRDMVLDKKGLTALMSDLARRHPDRYREVSHKLSRIGMHAAYTTGGNSFGLHHMRKARVAQLIRKQLQGKIQTIMDDDSLDEETREKKLILVVGRALDHQAKDVFEESLAEDNPLARMILGAGRGNEMNLSSLRGSDLLYTDHRDRVLPIPILRSYAEGLTPSQFWAASYGARRGIIDTKLAVSDAGFLSKQLGQIVHRLLVTASDADKEPDTIRGLPVQVDDEDNEGALLAIQTGDYPRNTILTPKILGDLKRKGAKRILVRSPTVFGPPDGGVYAKDAGIREFSRLPAVGENVALAAAQALGEPLSQVALSSKHSGGVAGASAAKAISGFDRISQLVQVPKHFKGGAAHTEKDGTVQTIEDAPAGGSYVTIDGYRHYVAAGFDIKVKKGDKVEAGDVISEGTPNPAVIVRHKGIGEGRRYFVDTFRQAIRDAGITGHRRNIELLARGLINHVRLTDEVGDFAPDDVVPYSTLEHRYKPRSDARKLRTAEAVGRYLEKPVLHYSIGTRVRPSMLSTLKEFGVTHLDVHTEQPPFEPEMIRGMANLQHDPDWITRMFGSGLKTGLLRGVQRGATSTETGTSFVPGLAKTVNFGSIGKVVTPKRNQEDDASRMQQQFKVGSALSCEAKQLRSRVEKVAELCKEGQMSLRERPIAQPQPPTATTGGLTAKSMLPRGALVPAQQQAYQPGGGLLNIYRMIESFAPGSGQQFIRGMGPMAPLAFASLFDTNAARSLAGMKQPVPQARQPAAQPKVRLQIGQKKPVPGPSRLPKARPGFQAKPPGSNPKWFQGDIRLESVRYCG